VQVPDDCFGRHDLAEHIHRVNTEFGANLVDVSLSGNAERTRCAGATQHLEEEPPVAHRGNQFGKPPRLWIKTPKANRAKAKSRSRSLFSNEISPGAARRRGTIVIPMAG
jgi:hypothetical protein